MFHRMRQRIKKKIQMERHQIRKALERAVTVPLDFSNLRSSSVTQLESRVYRHEELEEKSVTTIKWDGLWVLFLGPHVEPS